jgi:hypothetical protein
MITWTSHAHIKYRRFRMLQNLQQFCSACEAAQPAPNDRDAERTHSPLQHCFVEPFNEAADDGGTSDVTCTESTRITAMAAGPHFRLLTYRSRLSQGEDLSANPVGAVSKVSYRLA